MAQGELEKKIELNWLSAFYGGLLTPKQRDVMRMHCEEDLSLGEIAQEAGISRQAVHDVLARAESAMEAMEAKIGCVARARRQQKALEIITEAAAALSAMPQAKELAARILSAAETIKE